MRNSFVSYILSHLIYQPPIYLYLTTLLGV